MTYLEHTDFSEKTLEADWDWTRFAFGICYMYTIGLGKRNSVTIDITF